MRRGNLSVPAMRAFALLLALVALVCAPARAFATGTVDARDAQGNGTLGGAQFTVRYYDGYYKSLSKLPAEPRRSWVFKTDSDGKARFDAAHKVSGDKLYVDSDNVASMPLGTYTVQETKAPPGYKLTDPSVHMMQLVPDATSKKKCSWKNLDGWNNANADEDVEGRAVVDQVVRAGVSLVKRDAQGGSTPQGDASLAGIEFDIVNISTNKVYVGGVAYEPGEKVKGLLVTDAAGSAKTAADALPVGRYRVEEWYAEHEPEAVLTDTPANWTIRELRAQQGLSQAELARRSGLSQARISAIESHENPTALQRATHEKIARGLGMRFGEYQSKVLDSIAARDSWR